MVTVREGFSNQRERPTRHGGVTKKSKVHSKQREEHIHVR